MLRCRKSLQHSSCHLFPVVVAKLKEKDSSDRQRLFVKALGMVPKKKRPSGPAKEQTVPTYAATREPDLAEIPREKYLITIYVIYFVF